MTKTQRKRLEKLADYLDTKVERSTFHMRDFGHCAAHNACKLFAHAGFKEGVCHTPICGDAVGFLAISHFFGEETFAAGLFSASNPAKTPKQWAKACRKFLKTV